MVIDSFMLLISINYHTCVACSFHDINLIIMGPIDSLNSVYCNVL